MWTDGDDFSSEGEPVRLYQPIVYGRKPAQDDLACSYVGGETAAAEPPACQSCQEPLRLLVQIYVPKFPVADQGEPKNRTMQVFACNRAACINKLFQEQQFCYGGGGVVVCRRVTMAPTVPKKIDTASAPKPQPPRATAENTANEWDMDAVDDSGMDDLERKLAAMETAKPSIAKKTKAPALTKKPTKKPNTFPCFLMSTFNEPPTLRDEGLDDDDVGFSGTTDSRKIQQMLARYMSEEEDEGILAALKGTASGGDGGSSRGGERDERLSPQDRALLTYSDRLKRSPRQVVRYALGGCPLWSIPTPNPQSKGPNKPQPIPPCACGAQRVFETQLLPSLLHVLEVDKYADEAAADNGRATTTTSTTGLAAFDSGGMNWGNICVYSCPAACGDVDTEYVVVQDSVDERPTRRSAAYENDAAVLIPEDSKYDENDDDFGEDEGDDDSQDEEMECS